MSTATTHLADQPPAGAQPHRRPQRNPGQAAAPLRFLVTATRADGSTQQWTRSGGCSMDHIQQAMDAAGLGGVVRVLPLRGPHISEAA